MHRTYSAGQKRRGATPRLAYIRAAARVERPTVQERPVGLAKDGAQRRGFLNVCVEDHQSVDPRRSQARVDLRGTNQSREYSVVAAAT